jgi:hypothetical protein
MSLRWKHEGWRKLYVREEGSFALLPLYTRAFAGELLKICDSVGKIACMGKEAWKAIAWRLGATRGDRRLIKRDVGLLLKDGYLVLRPDGDLVIRNFLRAHPHLDTCASQDLGPEGFDEVAIPIAGDEGADVHDLPPAHVAPLDHTADVPGAVGLQMGLFGDGPVVNPALARAPMLEISTGSIPEPTPRPVTVTLAVVRDVPDAPDVKDPRPVHDASTTVPRRSSQVPDPAAVRSEEKRRSDPEREISEGPPPVIASRVDPAGPDPEVSAARRLATTLARTEDQQRQALASELGLSYTPLPLHATIAAIVKLLADGWSEDALTTAMRAYHAEARRKQTLEWWNAVDNWKPQNLRRALGKTPPQRRPPAASTTPPTHEATATTANAPRSGGTRLPFDTTAAERAAFLVNALAGDLDSARRAIGSRT